MKKKSGKILKTFHKKAKIKVVKAYKTIRRIVNKPKVKQFFKQARDKARGFIVSIMYRKTVKR